MVPPSRGGVVAQFPVHRLRSYTGTMSFQISQNKLLKEDVIAKCEGFHIFYRSDGAFSIGVGEER